MHALPKDTVRLISSSQVVSSVCSCVKELLENALDAGATSIDVRLENYGLDLVEVKDNGCGVSRTDVQQMARMHHTSKISSHADLASLTTYGFRGEALGSLASVGELSVTTRPRDADMGHIYKFNNKGEVTSEVPTHFPQGTSVAVAKLFKYLPVRKQLYAAASVRRNELKRLQTLLIGYGIICPHVRLCLKHDRSVVWQKGPSGDSLAGLAATVGASAAKCLQRVERSIDALEGACIEMFLPSDRHREQCLRSTSDQLFVFVNKRPVIMKEIEKLVKEYAVSELDRTSTYRCPFGIISLTVPPNSVDVNLEPNKTSVLLQSKDAVLLCLREMLASLYGTPQQSTAGADRSPVEGPEASCLTPSSVPGDSSASLLHDSDTSGSDRGASPGSLDSSVGDDPTIAIRGAAARDARSAAASSSTAPSTASERQQQQPLLLLPLTATAAAAADSCSFADILSGGRWSEHGGRLSPADGHRASALLAAEESSLSPAFVANQLGGQPCSADASAVERPGGSGVAGQSGSDSPPAGSGAAKQRTQTAATVRPNPASPGRTAAATAMAGAAAITLAVDAGSVAALPDGGDTLPDVGGRRSAVNPGIVPSAVRQSDDAADLPGFGAAACSSERWSLGRLLPPLRSPDCAGGTRPSSAAGPAPAASEPPVRLAQPRSHQRALCFGQGNELPASEDLVSACRLSADGSVSGSEQRAEPAKRKRKSSQLLGVSMTNIKDLLARKAKKMSAGQTHVGRSIHRSNIKETSVNFSVDGLRSLYKSECSESCVHHPADENVQLIGSVSSYEGSYFCLLDQSKIVAFNPFRVKEQKLFLELMESHFLPSRLLPSPVKITPVYFTFDTGWKPLSVYLSRQRHMCGDALLWDLLQQLPTGSCQLGSAYADIIDERLARNGVHLRRDVIGGEVELLSKPCWAAAQSDGVPELVEVLTCLLPTSSLHCAQSSETASACRPLRVVHYLQAEAVRMVRSMSPLTAMEVLFLLRTTWQHPRPSSSDPIMTECCIHNRLAFTQLHSLASVKL